MAPTTLAILFGQRFLAELDGCHSLDHQPIVEAEKGGDKHCKKGCQAFTKQGEKHDHKRCTGIVIAFFDGFCHCPNNEVTVQRCVQEEQKEKLVVVKANAVVDPRTMMVHFENAGLANSAVVTPVWLVLATPLAMAPHASSLHFLQAHRYPSAVRPILR